MDIISTLLVVTSILVVVTMIFIVNFNDRFEVIYITWSHPKKWIFSIIFGFTPWLFIGDIWVLMGILFTFQYIVILERQKYIFSIRIRK